MATTWVFLVPYTVSSFALMFGNWSQHIFINPLRPHDSLGLAYNCAGCADNAKSFNDGYHAVHHFSSPLHWSELPKKCLETLEEHGKAEALIFVDIGFFEVGAAVFGGQWNFLLRHVARYTKKFAAMSDAEIVAELQSRLKPVRS